MITICVHRLSPLWILVPEMVGLARPFFHIMIIIVVGFTRLTLSGHPGPLLHLSVPHPSPLPTLSSHTTLCKPATVHSKGSPTSLARRHAPTKASSTIGTLVESTVWGQAQPSVINAHLQPKPCLNPHLTPVGPNQHHSSLLAEASTA